MKRTLGAVAALLSFVAALALARGDDAKPPVKLPAGGAFPEENEITDSTEAEVVLVERILDGYRVGVTQMCPDLVLSVFSDDFQGDTIFDASETSPQEVGFTRVIQRGKAPHDRKGLGEAVDRFLSRVDAVTLYVTKVASAKRVGDEVQAVLKHSLQGRIGKGSFHIQDRFSAVLKNGKIVSETRIDGRRVESQRPVFVDATQEIGLATRPNFDCHFCTYRDWFNNATGGVAVADFDGDGYQDVFLAGSARSHLFRNKGDGTFEDVTEKAGLSDAAGSGAIWFDYDGDGLPDLLVTRYCSPDPKHKRCSLARNRWCGGKGCAIQLYRNKGDGTFENVTEKAGLCCTGPANAVCAADIDKDGHLDLFVGRYGWVPSTVPDEHGFSPKYEQPSPTMLDATNALPHLLFHNKGDGTFEEIGKKAGVADTRWTLSACFLDFDGDGYPDLYVVNDYGRNTLYRNKGDLTFEDASDRIPGDRGFGMGVARGDFLNDGTIGLYVSKMFSTAGNRIIDQMEERNRSKDNATLMRRYASGSSLFKANGDGTFTDVTKGSGTDRAAWAWGTVFCDYENDGRPDICAVNGFVSAESRRDA